MNGVTLFRSTIGGSLDYYEELHCEFDNGFQTGSIGSSCIGERIFICVHEHCELQRYHTLHSVHKTPVSGAG